LSLVFAAGDRERRYESLRPLQAHLCIETALSHQLSHSSRYLRAPTRVAFAERLVHRLDDLDADPHVAVSQRQKDVGLRFVALGWRAREIDLHGLCHGGNPLDFVERLPFAIHVDRLLEERTTTL
jgi:hypothetical protein